MRNVAMPKTRRLTETALLTALLTISGAIKLPGLIPGTEFQLSAPLAVAVCGVFGFSTYMMAGILSSLIGLILGTQTLLHVGVAMIFRVVVGICVGVFGATWPVLIIAGPIGSSVARITLGNIIGKAAAPLLLAALPGMVYTALAAWPLALLLKRVKAQTERVMQSVQR
ncbi:hypothetical protein PIPA1_45470 [Pelosinus sp. IPA-1]|nr:hypothetical protein PIPA1_45470 [Pelosinus sp. IPA-1]